ncbi:MAG: hypothetical protein AABW85_02100 [archaeon]
MKEWGCTPETVPPIFDCSNQAINCAQYKKPVSTTIDCTTLGGTCKGGRCIMPRGGTGGPYQTHIPPPEQTA